MTTTTQKLKGAALFKARGRYAGHDSAEAQQSAGMAAVEAEIDKGTRNPPGYGRQLPQAQSLPFTSAPQGPPQAPSAEQAKQRGSSAPPYQLTKGKDLKGAALMNFRSRFGRDPAPEEQVDPRSLGGAA